MSWRNRQLDLRCLDDVGVLDLVWLLSEEMTSCNFMRQCSKSQLWAEPEDEDVTVVTLEQEPERRQNLSLMVETLMDVLVTNTGCPRRNVQYFGRVFLMLNYTDITQNTYIQS